MNSSSKAVLYAGRRFVLVNGGHCIQTCLGGMYSLLVVLWIASFTSFVVLALWPLCKTSWEVLR
jgi:hypothetical protein